MLLQLQGLGKETTAALELDRTTGSYACATCETGAHAMRASDFASRIMGVTHAIGPRNQHGTRANGSWSGLRSRVELGRVLHPQKSFQWYTKLCVVREHVLRWSSRVTLEVPHFQ